MFEKVLGDSQRLLRGLLVAGALCMPSTALAATTLRVAYIPIMPMSQLFVMESEGWTKAAGLDLELTKFSSGPAIVQAIASGDFDVMYFGIGPAMVSRARGVPIKVVASNVIEQVGLLARGEFAAVMKDATTPAEGIRAFSARFERRPRIASLPKGSVPDMVLRHWLYRVAGLDLDAVDIVGMGADKVQQALLARSVDGAAILEPVVTIVRRRLDDTVMVAQGAQMFPKQPGAVLAVREHVIEERREAVAALVELHVRATALIGEQPERAARHIHAFLGRGLVPLEVFEEALASPLSHFVADPREIIAATKVMHDFAAEIGTLKNPVDLDEMFDPSFFEALPAPAR